MASSKASESKELVLNPLLEVEFRADPVSVYHVSFSPDGKTLLTLGSRGVSPGTEERLFRQWDISSKELIAIVKDYCALIPVTCKSRDGKYVASIEQKSVQIVHVPLGAAIVLEKHPTDAVAMCFSPDNCHFFVCGVDGFIRIWNVFSTKYIGKLNRPTKICSMDISPDNRLLAVGGDHSWVQVFLLPSEISDNHPDVLPICSPKRKLSKDDQDAPKKVKLNLE